MSRSIKKSSMVIIKRINPIDGELEFLVMDSVQLKPSARRYTGHKMIKFPGGDEKYAGESPAEIANREVLEETGLAYLEADEIWTAKSQTIHKHGFLVDFSACTGELNKEPVYDGSERLENFRWVRARSLNGRIFEGGELFYSSACRLLRVF